MSPLRRLVPALFSVSLASALPIFISGSSSGSSNEVLGPARSCSNHASYGGGGGCALKHARGPIENSYINPINPVWLATIVLFGVFLVVVVILGVLHTRSVRKVDRLLKAQQQHIELDDFVARPNRQPGPPPPPPPPFGRVQHERGEFGGR
ncbi:hypothetical protein F5X99DRAFT_406370 [Biscogniauxia marginata]|nr:hypothetical protein F5X99DRAFT_406370 [Biscogniauxia marginata]